MAQTQLVDDKDLGVRFTIPKDWEWRSRDRDVFVNCSPKIDRQPRGMPGCWFTVAKRKLSPGQDAITDADRTKWKGWVSADGMRPIVSTRDLKVAGYPAYEVVAREGKNPSDGRSVRVYVLVPDTGVIDAWLTAYWGDKDQSALMEPPFRAALESLKVVK